MAMSSSTFTNPTSKPTTLLFTIKSKLPPPSAAAPTTTTPSTHFRRRHLLTASISGAVLLAAAPSPSPAASDEEYVKETVEVINKVRSTISMDKKDPNVAEAVTELRAASNAWVAKYRREKALLGRASFRDMYSALNAVSGHYVSFGPTTPIPAKRRVRILEEMDTAEKSLKRGR